VTLAAVIAVDGGNSKTDVVLVGHDGALLASVRGPTVSPERLGPQGCFAALDDLVAKVVAAGLAGWSPGEREPFARVAGVYLAGADFPREIAALETLLAGRGWAVEGWVTNDTFALLRAGTDARDAVAVVCGAGINCVGVSADGRQVRFPALGRISGDWGGGGELGLDALWWAVREEDGRGPHTAMTGAVAEHFGVPSATAVAEALHFGELDEDRLVELAPVVVAAAEDGDAVAVEIMDRLADEIATMATTTLSRLGLLDRAADIVLGGGVLARAGDRLLEAIRERVLAVAPGARFRVVAARPVLGAALAGLDRIGAGPTASARLRRDLSE
jgi:N-acetylglucosamine kinase-like BadF-type ATPase